MTKIESARYYCAVLRWSIIPIAASQKRPVVQWKQYQDTPASLYQIEKWWGSKRDAEPGTVADSTFNVALVTGKASGIIVIDEDSYKEAFKGLPVTTPLVATTPRGGRHLYFKYTDGINNAVNQDTAIDIRGEGGYVLLPPSAVAGKSYRWNHQPTRELLEKLPKLPQPIIDELNAGKIASDGKPYNLSESIGVSAGARDISLYKGIVSMINRIDEKEWETEGWRMAVAMNATYDPPMDERAVREKFNSATRFIRANPKKPMESRGGWAKVYLPPKEEQTREIPRPRTITEVAGEREIEKQMELVAPSTGYSDLDGIIRGWIPGHLYTLTGMENIGKTSIACNFAVRASKQGGKVLYFALEPENSVVDYIASARLDKRFEDLSVEDISYDDGTIHIYGKEQVSKIDDLVRTINNLERYDMVVIDHLGYFITDGKNTIQEQSNVIKRLAGLAKSKRCAIIMIAHLRKLGQNQKRKGYIPTSDDISGSGSFKQDSTEVLIITRKMQEGDGNVLTNEGKLFVTKTKAGPNGSMPLYFSDKKANIMSTSEVFSKARSIQKDAVSSRL